MREIELVKVLLQHLHNKEFDLIITSGRGGLVASQFIAYAKKIKPVIALTNKRTTPRHIGPERRVLYVDDINDTGDTMRCVLANLRQQGIENITTAVLLERHSALIKADYVGEMIGHNDWHNFTWDKEL